MRGGWGRARASASVKREHFGEPCVRAPPERITRVVRSAVVMSHDQHFGAGGADLERSRFSSTRSREGASVVSFGEQQRVAAGENGRKATTVETQRGCR